MENQIWTPITVSAVIKKDIAEVWDKWTNPAHIIHWNQASDDWHCPFADNDLQVGGQFLYTMAAKDGSFSFDFMGEFTAMDPYKRLAYLLGDSRKVDLAFSETPEGTLVVETFDAETENTLELQQAGWQAILDSFKRYVEA